LSCRSHCAIATVALLACFVLSSLPVMQYWLSLLANIVARTFLEEAAG
jgi:hypothetical protein